MKNNHRSLNFAVSMTLFTVFALFMTLVLLMGASSFRNVADGAQSRYNERTSLFYISQKVRGFDRADSVKVADIGGVRTLILVNDFRNIYIYEKDGYICELYSLHGESPDLRVGTPILPVTSLEFESESESLIKITVDGKVAFVSLMSEMRESA
ncbi:MAG: DUF4860 domain-containing protein [Oscillospiraceae bacterium]|nr:DUF4860 domain-containing protein [Oscillospiraceae bacterium]